MRTKGAVSNSVITLRKLNSLLKPGAKVIVSKAWADMNLIRTKPVSMLTVKQGGVRAN